MEAINLRLKELEASERELNALFGVVKKKQEAEDAEWEQRFADRDREEGVSVDTLFHYHILTSI